MPDQKTINLELIKDLLEHAGLSTVDVLRLLVPGLTLCSGVCADKCVNCLAGCANGPIQMQVRDNTSSELDQLKREILAELKR